MKLRLEDKRKAIELRREGFTYNEIREKIPNLSKGTLSGWLKNIELSLKHKTRILSKISLGAERGRLKGAWTNKSKALDRIDRIQHEAEIEYYRYAQNPLFFIFLSLYWAEGAKKSRCFQFVNSDPKMVKLVFECLRILFGISEEKIRIRLYIHKVYANENCEKFWSEVLNVSADSFKRTVYKPTIHNTKKNIKYKGCCRVDILGSEFYWKVEKWMKMMIKSV